MGESPIRCGHAFGRLAALGIAFAGGALLVQAALAQSRSPAGDKTGAKGLAGTVVQFEEKPSRAVVYLEEKGGLVTPVASPAERDNGEAAAPVAPRNPAGRSADAKAAELRSSARVGNGPSPLRSSQSKPAAAPSAARP